MANQNDADTKLLSEKLLRAAHLQAIENNPLDEDDLALFEMFERKGWTHEQCLAWLNKLAHSGKPVPVAE